ncbi:MAG: flagellar filament capping protein FliD [Clostridiales bacterium]|nr:flagellar filament capping protein FliD [Clostridiales bacterium]
MATNNINSNYFSVAAYTNKGLSGMVSGLDTENMVKTMMAGTQKKINTQLALKQQALWRQEIYRDIINSINNVRNKYFNPAFDASPLNNFANSKFFNMKSSSVTAGTSGSAALKVLSTSANAIVGDMSVAVKQLAAAASLSSQASVGAGDTITGKDISTTVLNDFNNSLNLMINNQNVVVNLNGVTTQEDMVAKINEALVAYEHPTTLETTDTVATIVNGQLKFFSESGDLIRVGNATTSLAYRMTGLNAGQTSSAAGSGQSLSAGNMINPGAGVTFTVNLDGVDKQITLNPANSTVAGVQESLQNELDKAFGNYINVNVVDGNKIQLELRTDGGLEFGGLNGHTLTLYGTEANKLGISAGASTRLNTSSQIGNLEGLMGERFAFTINGVDFSFTKDDTIGAMINKVNSSTAGVTMSYSSLSGQFKLTANATGSQGKIDISQKEGDLLGAIFKDSDGDSMFNPSNTAVSQLLTTKGISGSYINPTTSNFSSGAKFTINVNGEDHTYTLSAGVNGVNGETMLNNLNNWLKSSFGTVGDIPGGDANIEFDNAGGRLIIRDGSLVKFAHTDVNTTNSTSYQAGIKTDIALALGLNNVAKDNLATAGTLVEDIYQLDDLVNILETNFPGIVIPGTVGELGTLSDTYPLLFAGIMDHAEIGFSGGRLTLTATTDGVVSTNLNLADSNTDPAALIRNALGALLGGLDSLVYTADAGSLVDDALFTAGKDAQIIVNGIETSRSSNTFEIDGVTMQLTSTSSILGGTGTTADPYIYDETVITTERDTEAVVGAFKSFVEDYNDMIRKLYGYVREEALFRDYAPLTDEQKKEMSDRDIELWEQNAKTGLIRNDMEVTNLLNNLFSTLYTKPLSSNYALYDIGIEASDYKQPGILFLDEDKLRAALLNDPMSVENLFMDPLNGLAKQMGGLMDGAARVSLANPGSLVALAGVENSVTDKSNILNTSINEINERLKDLWERYEKERARYWQKFNTMEQILARYQAQSEWIYQNMVLGMGME